jgi:polyhydroxybutyrate depolymerase
MIKSVRRTISMPAGRSKDRVAFVLQTTGTLRASTSSTCPSMENANRIEERSIVGAVAVRVALGIALLSAGIFSARSVRAGSDVQTIQVNGSARTYRLHRPAGLTGPVPLVVMLHGGFGSGQQAENAYGWDQLADKAGFMVAYPDGLNRAWNSGGGCCGQPAKNGVDDVAFIDAMVKQIESTYAVDPARIYATGISNGGMMAYALACGTNIFAAIGPDSATMLSDCATAAPISVIHIHGLADTRIRFNGGRGDGVANIDGPAVPDVIAFWRKTDQCADPTTTTSGPVTTSSADCPDGREVTLITITGAGHQWPGAVSRPALQALLGLDTPSTAIDATSVIWDFFAAHPKP